MTMQTIPRRIARLASTILFIAMLTFAGDPGRCKLCPPATWATIQMIAQTQAAKAGPSYRIGTVRAKPSFRTTLLTDGPFDVTLSFELISAEADQDMTNKEMYPTQTFEFTDRDPRITWQNQHDRTSELPTVESQQRLSRVLVAPRDVYRTTWNVAQRELSSSIHLSDASMHLYTDEPPQEQFGSECVWVISYHDNMDNLIFWIDAQTGKVVHQTKERFRKP